MKQLPQRPNIDHLKRQAKDLLVLYRSRDLTAIARFRSALPAAAGKDDQAISQLGLRLHDAQSCLAREYGFSSWAGLKSFVEVSNAQAINLSQSVLNWLRLIYAGDIAGGANRARPSVAARLLKENPVSSAMIPMLHARSETSPSCAKRPRKAKRGSTLRVAP